MGILKVGVLSAQGVANIDWGLAGKSDPYVVVVVGKQQKQSKTIRNCLDPTWDEVYEFTVEDATEEVVSFILWDEETSRQDTIIASASIGMNSLLQGQEQRLQLPLLRAGSEGRGSGTITVTLQAVDFDGLKAEVARLQGGHSRMSAEAKELSEARDALAGEAEELRTALAGLEAEVLRLREAAEAAAAAGTARASAELLEPTGAASRSESISPAEEAALRALWDSCNMDGDSSRITRAELQAAVIKTPSHQAVLGLSIRPDKSGRRQNQKHTLESFFKLLDLDSSGCVTWEELKATFALHVARCARESS